jgi:hypothetical protein
VAFPTIVHKNGARERWRQPKLARLGVPRRDPAEPRPNAPDVVAQQRAARQRWRARQRVRDAQHAAAARYEEARTPDSSAAAAARETAS